MSLTLSQASGITYARSYNWQARFETAPEPFSSFFPAIDCALKLASVTHESFEIGASEFKIPKGRTASDLRFTFLDDDKNSLMNWIDEWCSEIVPKLGRVRAISSSVRKCYVVPLTVDKKMAINPIALWVVPDVDFYMNRNVDSALTMYEASFYVAGRVR